MILAIYGAGYVGLVTAVCLAKLGHKVIGVDINPKRVQELKDGQCPIYEAQLPELLCEQLEAGRLEFTDDFKVAVQMAELHIIATGTPSQADGSADLSQVFSVAARIADEANKSCLIVTKSTVPVGTGDAIQTLVEQRLQQRQAAFSLHVASNPEFLREGVAVDDFFHADRIVIGGDEDALQLLKTLYQPLTEQGVPLLCMSRVSAEMTKYAANGMLACRISYMNEISRLAEAVGANIDEIRQGMGSDTRIGPYFLQAGIGYGGSCFPKDVRALAHSMRVHHCSNGLLIAIEESNEQQKHWVAHHLNQHFQHDLSNKVIGLWGLSFKPETDDLREASSLVIINALLATNAKLRIYDPVAMPAAQALFAEDAITWCESATAVLSGLDALVIVTEWQEFKNYSLPSLRAALANAPLLDGRNCFSLEQVKQANLAYYYSVGRPTVKPCEEKDIDYVG
jgi:UDPglucose 6-dehydrogenase